MPAVEELFNEIASDRLVAALLRISDERPVAILDSCGVGHLGSHLLIAGIHSSETSEIADSNGVEAFDRLSGLESADSAAVITLSYDFGLKATGISSRHREDEPDLSLMTFPALIVHDYDSGKTSVIGDANAFPAIRDRILQAAKEPRISMPPGESEHRPPGVPARKEAHGAAVAEIKEEIRAGNTYQANLTQRFAVNGVTSSPQSVFWRLRRDHPAPFAAFIARQGSSVVSASPERFFTISPDRSISTSPIKGTRPRGSGPAEDAALRSELVSSEKDRAENTMIVDLLRNDLGRVCVYGSVRVERLCEVEEHPTLFHLVSTVSGDLRDGVGPADVIAALFPCGSITGAPKISTMKILDRIEPASRGLSMGAIGYVIPRSWQPAVRDLGLAACDLSVAIRTIVMRGDSAFFNAGGGIVIDSDPDAEFDEMNLKAKALLAALS